MAIPTVKLISVATPKIPEASAGRSALPSRSIAPYSSPPTDLRWSRVEEFFRSRELRPNTHKSYKRAFRAFLSWTDKGWQDITARDIDRYKEYLKALPSERGGQRCSKSGLRPSPATINLALSALQSLFKWLCARDYIAKDPMLLLEMPKPDPVQPQEWSADEVRRLFAATQQRGQTAQRDRALLWVLLHGLRAREVEALNLADFDGQRLHIREAKDDSVGQVPLLPEAIAALQGYLCARGEEVGSESPLFVSESNNSKGQRLSYWGIYKVVKDLASIAGVEDSHPHRGRHTVATQMVSRGMNPLLARQITRHKSEKSFERYSQRALQIQAEEQFLQLFADRQDRETVGDEDTIADEHENAIQLEAVAEEPSNWPQVKPVAMPLNEIDVVRVYQLKITLLGVRPKVWRRIQVQETMTLAQLHSVLQAVMGWEGYHLHEFPISEDETLTLAALIGDELFSFSYLYDFGDMWQHEIEVEKRLASEPGNCYPVCLAGKRACPPEDCGGDWGYAHLLKVLKNPRHPEYRERKEWVGRGFNPKAFDLKEVNQALRELELQSAGATR
ncbi:MAG: tyrosine-type recombinase/integrase [Acaryochloris sp. RU_4_1]|nr:tyrosine-type recombinase/integrase [Acaryochloris sp. RU_4_1]